MIRGFLVLIGSQYVGLVLARLLNLPTPDTINGMIILALLLYFKVIKLETVDKVASVLLLNMTIFFMPPAIKIIESEHLLKNDFLKIVFLIFMTTLITMVVTGRVVQFLIERNNKKSDN